MTDPIDVIANAVAAVNDQPAQNVGATVPSRVLAEVAVRAVCEHIAQYRAGDRSTQYYMGWDDALGAILKTLGHGDR